MAEITSINEEQIDRIFYHSLEMLLNLSIAYSAHCPPQARGIQHLISNGQAMSVLYKSLPEKSTQGMDV